MGMLTSSRPTNSNTISFAAATIIEPALMMSNAPKNSPARASLGSRWAIPSRIPAEKSSTSRAVERQIVVQRHRRVEIGVRSSQAEERQDRRQQVHPR